MKRLWATGLGIKIKRAEPITVDEEEQLWANGVLGDKDPRLYTAKAAFIYILHTELYAYVDTHRHRYVLAQPKGQLSITNYL